MNKRACFLLSFVAISPFAQAAVGPNVIRTQAPIVSGGDWQDVSALTISSVQEGVAYDCQNWSPATSEIDYGLSFTQNSDDCKQNIIITTQNRQQNKLTGAFRNVGSPKSSSQIESATSSRDAVGTLGGEWQDIAALTVSSTPSGSPYSCVTWTPDPSEVEYGTAFTQNSSDCQQNLTVVKQNRQQNAIGTIRNVGEPQTSTEIISATSSRDAVGTLGGKWQDIAALTLSSTPDGEPFACVTWTPDPSSIDYGTTFTQTSPDCQQNMTVVKQNRQQNALGTIRNTGEPQTSTEVVVASSSRDSVGTNADGWQSFATKNGLNSRWDALNWSFTNLSTLPSKPYPLSNPSSIAMIGNSFSSVASLSSVTSIDSIILAQNQLTSLDGLQNIVSARSMTFSNNLITNLDGLRSLQSVDVINVANNKITNLNGLAKLKTVLLLTLSSNPITNIDGLANTTVTGTIVIDKGLGIKKLPASSVFCTTTKADAFQSAPKTELCES